MNRRSIWAVAAGILVVLAVTMLIDVGLHATGVFPALGQPIDDALALLASSYRIVVGVGAAWLTARLAPRHPMRHALALGAIGTVLSLVGVVTTWNLGLGPRWYPISLVVLALPESWVGGRLFELRTARRPRRP